MSVFRLAAFSAVLLWTGLSSFVEAFVLMIAGDFARAVKQGHGAVPIVEHPELGPGEMMPVLALWNLQDMAVIADRIVQQGDALLLDAQDIIELATTSSPAKGMKAGPAGAAAAAKRALCSFL